MRKILLIFFLFSSSLLNLNASEELNIISREQWGANENYRYIDSPEWQTILKNREEANKNELTDSQKERIKKSKEMNQILTDNFYEDIKLIKVIREENGHKLAWPIQKTKKVNAIIIHHTHSDFENSIVGMKSIYKFHALTRQWGDIGYNFVIGKQGEIFEGRAGGDYTVSAHNKWNNRSTVGIALMGDYSEKKINTKQYDSLKKLTKYLVKKYSINLDKKANYHEECFGAKCEKPLLSFKLDSITGHRDSSTSSCPGDELYKQIGELKIELKNDPDLKQDILKAPQKVQLNLNKDKLDDEIKKIFSNMLKIIKYYLK